MLYYSLNVAFMIMTVRLSTNCTVLAVAVAETRDASLDSAAVKFNTHQLRKFGRKKS